MADYLTLRLVLGAVLAAMTIVGTTLSFIVTGAPIALLVVFTGILGLLIYFLNTES